MSDKTKKFFRISGHVINLKTRKGIPGLRVEGWDKDLIVNDLVASAVTDESGAFKMMFDASHFAELFLDRQPDLFFKIFRDTKLLKSTEDSVLWNMKTGKREVEIELSTEAPAPAGKGDSPPPVTPINLDDVLRAATIKSDVLDVLKQKKLNTLKDLFSPKGMQAIQKTSLKPAEHRKLLAFAKFAMASGNLSLSQRLADKGLTSMSKLGRMPQSRIEKLLGKLDPAEKSAAAGLQRAGQLMHNAVTSTSVQIQRSISRDANWYAAPDDKGNLVYPDLDLCGDGDPCFNVFSPIAYIFDLLHFINDSWDILSDTLEGLFFQEIDELDCETGFKPVLQIRLGIKALGKYRSGLPPVNSPNWNLAYRQAGEQLLALAGLKLERLPQAARDEFAAQQPTPDTWDTFVGAIRDAYRKGIDAKFIEPQKPPLTETEKHAQYLLDSATIKQQRENAYQEFENRINLVTFPLLAIYRDALIENAGEPVEKLEERLFIDLRSVPSQITNQITQVIQSLQSFILAMRTRDILEHPRADIAAIFVALFSADDYEFDEATWTWLAEYGIWSSAMYTLVYPENVISLPAYRSSLTHGFRQSFSSMPSPANIQNVNLAVEAYDDYLRAIGELRPISAHVIDDTLYLFATTRGELWLNKLPRGVETPGGWQRVSEAKENMSLWTTALFTDEDRISIIVAYQTEDKRFTDINIDEDTGIVSGKYSVGKLDLFRVLPEGTLQDDLPIKEIDLTASPRFGETGHDADWVLETHEIDGKLHPVLRRWTSYSRGAAVNADSITEGECIALGVVGSTTTAWVEAEPHRKLPHMFLIDGNYYYFSTSTLFGPGVSGDNILIGRGNFDPNSNWQNDEPGYWMLAPDPDVDLVDQNDSPGQKSYLIATNHRGDDSFLIGCTDNSTIVCRSFNPVTREISASWTAVSTSLELTQVSLDDVLLLGINKIASCARQIYFEEKFLYVPLFAGWALNRAGDYASAHDRYRKLYDPFGQKTKYGFPFQKYFSGDFSRPENWLADPLDPYAIAAQRGGVYLRHTILMMVKNLLDWADHEFARSGPEALNRARELYLLAGRILKAPELHNLCLNGLRDLRITILTNTGIDADVLVGGFKDLEGIDSKEIIDATIRIIDDLIYSDKSLLEKSRLAGAAVTKAVDSARLISKAEKLGNVYAGGQDRIEPLENALVPKILPQFLNANPNNTFVRTSASLGFSITTTKDFSIPPNPLLKAFGFHIEANLAKLHAGLNIALDWASQPPSLSMMSTLSGEGIGTAGFIDPPRYRYSYLAEKARQQVSFAQQLGAELLQTIEKGEGAAYDRLQAEHAIAVAEATMTLKDLSREDADSGLQVANQQKSKASVQRNFWNKRVDTGYNGGFLGFGVGGISEAEMTGMILMTTSGVLQGTAALIYGTLVLPAAIAGLAGSASAAGSVGEALTVAGAGAAVATGGVSAVLLGGAALGGGPMLAQAFQASAGAVGTFGSLALTIASFQRRWEDWNLQYDLSNLDVNIAYLQVTQAQGRIAIANQDREIANLQSTHAVQVLNFLMTKKFSNLELYEWMRDVLLAQYKIVMQIATSTALLAQRSLEFERQEAINIVTDDYWSVDPAALSASRLTTEQKSAGLLGAERLATALTQLDDNKLQKDRRHLQVSKTISLARQMPTELVELRQSGRITFNTLMEWFDWDFPGHYLRLIKSVKVSVLALIPPVDGIHAMLSNTGESSVVVNANGAFVKQRSMRTFGELIALDSAYNDSGLFVLDYNDAMFLPFEGLGVETQWTFELPSATNRFNFDTIADVLLTIEYTALYDSGYADQVRTRLGDTASTDKVVDAASFFPDEWYHLKNPRWEAGVAHDLQQLKLSLSRTFFPPNFLDTPALNATQLNLIVAGDFNDQDDSIKSAIRDTLRTGLTVLQNGAPVRLSSVFFDNYALFFTRTGGLISREYWTNIAGNAVSDIPLMTTPTTRPNGMDILPSLEGPMNWGDNYGSRICGYITAPTDGDYIFWIASDDNSELWLSSDHAPINKERIASVGTSSIDASTADCEWNKFPSQKSRVIALTAGDKYYVEVLHKAGAGDDHVAVGWSKPGEAITEPSEVIPGAHLSLYFEERNVPDGLPPQTNPVGDWVIQLDPKIYGAPVVSGSPVPGQKPIIERISDVVMILTVQGKIKW